jgi:serine/threonine protein kinase
LRDGDWSAARAGGGGGGAAGGKGDSAGGVGGGGDAMDVDADGGRADGAVAAAADDDERLEGTTAYLAPELMQGGLPSVESDAWAFGVTLFQMVAGRLPLWADSTAEMANRIVHFSPDSLAAFPPASSEALRDCILALLVREPTARLGGCASGGVERIVAHPFFAGLPPLELLYESTPPKLNGGAVAPAPNAAWARRQNSVMWSPLPSSYSFSERAYEVETIDETELEADAPFGTRC